MSQPHDLAANDLVNPPLLASIIIPAHNEATTIERCLSSLLDGRGATEAGRFEVIVACNGCTDNTAELVRSLGWPVEILDISTPGKPNALRLAEARATVLPRIYLDADITLTNRAATALAEAMTRGAIAARPPIQFDLTGATWLVRRFWAARQRLANVMADLCGGGAYGLSAAARGRFDEFPDITSDDLFVARHIKADEIVIVETDPLVVRTPRTASAQLKVLKRVYRGNQEMATKYPAIAEATTSSTMRNVISQARQPRNIPDVVVYVGFVVLARIALRFDKSPARWERDDSAR